LTNAGLVAVAGSLRSSDHALRVPRARPLTLVAPGGVTDTEDRPMNGCDLDNSECLGKTAGPNLKSGRNASEQTAQSG
jgi:hypothetical protein